MILSRQVLARPGTSVALIAVVTFVLCLLQQQFMPAVPQIQDEFSYLLASDTYSHGRLTNPGHVLWPFFEAPHVVVDPTYQSKYPPGQGLALAVGQLLTGRPVVGVWLSFAAACAAVGWMLRAWLPARWALLGGLMVALNVGNLRFWGGTFMGGAVGMLGGALVFGALARAFDDPRPRYGCLMALGLLALAMSRPFEGLVATLPAGLVMLVWLLRQKERPRARVWKRLVGPLVLTLLLGFAWFGYYNYRVTGDPLLLPYQIYLERHGNDAFFDPAAQPVNRQRIDDVREQIKQRFDRQMIHHIGGERYYGIAILVALRWLLKTRWGRLSLVTVILTLLATAFTRGAVPHYSAPIAGLAIGLVVQSLAVIVSWIRPLPLARLAVMVAIGVYLAENLGHFRRERSYWDYKVEQSLVARPPEVPIPDVHDLERLEDRQLWERFSRFAILVRPYWVGRLARDTDRHLVVVRYAENSNRHREWVYNRADIDGSKTIWARWRDDEPLWPLLAYYRDRRVWLIEPEREPWRLSRFPLEEVPPWHLREHEGARGRIELAGGDGGGARLEVLEPGAQRYQLQAEHAHPKLRAGRTYLGGFRARADAPRTLSIGVTQALYPWEGLGLRRGIRLGTDWRTYSWGFRANADYGAPRLLVNFGGEPAGVEIADVRLEEEPVAEGRADAR